MSKKTVNYNFNTHSTRKYGVAHLLLDVILTFATGGLWLIVVIISALKRR